MSLKFKCPQCDKKYSVKEELAGQKVKCGDCGQTLRVPGQKVEKTSRSAGLEALAPRGETPPALDLYGLEEESTAPPRGAAPFASRGIPDEEKLPPRAGYSSSPRPTGSAKKGKSSSKAKAEGPGFDFARVRSILAGAFTVLALVLFGWRVLRTVNNVVVVGQVLAGVEDAPLTPEQLKAEALAADKELATSIAHPTSGEAREWLDATKHQDHVVMELSNDGARKMVEGFYERGAVRVTAIEPMKLGGKWITAEFIIELPRDPAARKKCYLWEAEFSGSDEPEPDYGQKYLQVLTD